MRSNVMCLLVGALLLSAVCLPCALRAQPAATLSDSAVWSPRTFEAIGGVLRASAPFGDDAAFGLTLQVSTRRSQRVRWAVQAGAYWSADLTACDVACIGQTGDPVFISPLIGTGVRNRVVEVRAFVGPRLLLTDGPSALGGQITADFSFGNRLGALYFLATSSWHAFGGRALQQRSIGIGLQNR